MPDTGSDPYQVETALDHFKTINDKYGHPGGDTVLCGFVQTCAEAIRPYDIVARVGGEEFMVLLPGATLEDARLVGERLRSAIAGNAFEVGIPPPIKVTISIEVSEFGRDGDTLDELLSVANQRLYRAKREGRNCVIAT